VELIASTTERTTAVTDLVLALAAITAVVALGRRAAPSFARHVWQAALLAAAHGDTAKAVVVRTRREYRRADGSSYDEASPYDTWKTATYTLSQIRSWFAADSRTNVGTLVALDLRNRGVSGRLISVTLIGSSGTTKKVSGDAFRSIFNAHRVSGDPMMRSTLFDLKPIP